MKIIILLGLLTAVLVYSYEDAEMKRDFQELDKDGDGSLTLDEVFPRFFMDDVNGNGKLTYREFVGGLHPSNYSQEILRAAFNFYDKLDGTMDGVLDPMSILHTFRLLDDDNNKIVTLGEYMKAVREIIQIATKDASITA